MAIVHFVNCKKDTQSRAAMRGVMLYVMQEKKTAWEAPSRSSAASTASRRASTTTS